MTTKNHRRGLTAAATLTALACASAVAADWTSAGRDLKNSR